MLAEGGNGLWGGACIDEGKEVVLVGHRKEQPQVEGVAVAALQLEGLEQFQDLTKLLR
jgi:hypothetical protein